jgi:hypothetical protein
VAGLGGGRQRPRRGPADNELWREIENLDRTTAAVDPLEQQLSRLGAQLVVREAHRRKRRPEAVHERHVVEADHGDVVRALPAGFVKRGVTPDGQHVVGRGHRGDITVRGEQLSAAPRALLHGVPGRVRDQVLIYLEPVGRHPVPESAQPPDAGGGLLRTCDVRYPGMAEPGKMGDRHP